MNETKTCPRCRRELPLPRFHANRTRPQGVGTYCVECEHERYIERKVRRAKA